MKSCLASDRIHPDPTSPERAWDMGLAGHKTMALHGCQWLRIKRSKSAHLKKNEINVQSWVNTFKVAPSFNDFAGFCCDLKFYHLYSIQVCCSRWFSCSIFSGRTSPNYLIFYKLFHFSTMDGVSANWNPLKFTEKHPPTACEAAAQQGSTTRQTSSTGFFQIIISSLRKFLQKRGLTPKNATQKQKNNVQSSFFSAYIFSQTFFWLLLPFWWQRLFHIFQLPKSSMEGNPQGGQNLRRLPHCTFFPCWHTREHRYGVKRRLWHKGSLG